jgi:hypothetical protein
MMVVQPINSVGLSLCTETILWLVVLKTTIEATTLVKILPPPPPLHPSFIIHSIGSVYLFHGEGNQWSQSAKILAEDALANAFYGYSVSLFELEMLASAYKSDDAGIDSGLMNPTSS